jgi:hypothetical protein
VASLMVRFGGIHKSEYSAKEMGEFIYIFVGAVPIPSVSPAI